MRMVCACVRVANVRKFLETINLSLLMINRKNFCQRTHCGGGAQRRRGRKNKMSWLKHKCKVKERKKDRVEKIIFNREGERERKKFSYRIYSLLYIYIYIIDKKKVKDLNLWSYCVKYIYVSEKSCRKF